MEDRDSIHTHNTSEFLAIRFNKYAWLHRINNQKAQ